MCRNVRNVRNMRNVRHDSAVNLKKEAKTFTWPNWVNYDQENKTTKPTRREKG